MGRVARHLLVQAGGGVQSEPRFGHPSLTISTPLNRVRHEVEAAAETCREPYDAWIIEFALPLRERLRIEGRKEAEERGIPFEDPLYA